MAKRHVSGKGRISFLKYGVWYSDERSMWVYVTSCMHVRVLVHLCFYVTERYIDIEDE